MIVRLVIRPSLPVSVPLVKLLGAESSPHSLSIPTPRSTRVGTSTESVKPVEKNLYSGNTIALGDVHLEVTINGEQPDYSPPAII